MNRENREEGKCRPIPQTMTQLYSELTFTLMRRHLKERGDNWESLPRRLEDLPQEHPEVHRQLLSLAKLAFEAILKQKEIFEGLPSGCSTLGLMTASQQLYISSKGSTSSTSPCMCFFLPIMSPNSLAVSRNKLLNSTRDAEECSPTWMWCGGLWPD